MIRLTDVDFQYEGAPGPGLRQINLTIPRGQCVLVTGASGCGKTTLLRLLNGLVPHFYPGLRQGEVLIAGRRPEDWTMEKMSTLVGSVFQNPRSQFFNLDTTGEIAFGCENLGWEREKIQRRVQETAAVLEIGALLNKNIFSLSGGEKQLIAIASAYAMGPEIFVFDEPSANLDAFATERLAQLIVRLKAAGKTIIIAEHRLYYLRGIADRVIYMREGGIDADWTGAAFDRLGEAARAAYGLRAFCLDGLTFAEARDTPEGEEDFRVDNLSVRYKRNTPVLSGLSCEVKSGEIVAVIGHNGRGKTTFARCLCGLLREKGGQIRYRGQPLPYKKRRGKIYLVMQDSNYQLFSDSVAGELCLSGKAGGKEAGDWALRTLMLDEYRDRHPMTLSGGEKQRLAIAAGLADDAEIMILDEPTSGLDLANMLRVKEIMDLLRAQGKLVFIITHDYEFLLSTCNRVLEIDNGRVAADYPLHRDSLDRLRAFFFAAPSAVNENEKGKCIYDNGKSAYAAGCE